MKIDIGWKLLCKDLLKNHPSRPTAVDPVKDTIGTRVSFAIAAPISAPPATNEQIAGLYPSY